VAKVLVLLTAGFLVLGPAQPPQRRAGAIDFFGYQGIDLNSVRSALDVREGDRFPGARSSSEWKRAIRASVRRSLGRDATDVAIVCCDGAGNWLIYIGLPGESEHAVGFRPAPDGDVPLPAELVQANAQVDAAWESAVMKGSSGEDDSQGYALSQDPALRARQLAFRDLVRTHEAAVFDVLQHARDSRQRSVAATAAGYATPSRRQVDLLVAASLDPDDEVRNNAIRALGVLLRAKPDVAAEVPAAPFIALLKSGRWSDHNKAVFVLDALTAKRGPKILAELRSRAADSLVEMARWKNTGHAYTARVILGRIAGIAEGRLSGLAGSGQVDPILRALGL
jgi:hypothetical protein